MGVAHRPGRRPQPLPYPALGRGHQGRTRPDRPVRTLPHRPADQAMGVKQPRPQLATRLENEVRTRWQPQGRARARARQKAATTDGIMIDVQARFGYTATAGSTDQSRIRHLTLALPPHHATRLPDAQASGLDEDQLLQLTAEALGETYFRDNGRRAHGLEVELTDVLDLQFRL
ncbi:telomere-protecting terminal protein Tpg [Streptomyces brevispora]